VPAAQRAFDQWVQQRQQTSDHESQSCERLAPLDEVAEEYSIGDHQFSQEGGEGARELATTHSAEKQLSQLSRESSKQELIPTGQEPFVTNEDLKASQRNVRELSASGPGFR
jgi:hypothetical protein